ncbi:Ppx/GppA phosphatase family protein [Saccharopolyspora phatthalungensis]|uniref:Exopolyphosphatase/guanosine-5'-triphosphate, 3'-diphosphate pyrophosphatase n=1 Tax=Saccharopolyspora phatthalungensis TaxID=664693 RepID=A0A840Q1V9_9PSEU|nr:exopolyphosphatase [Saccharopolyspora phatthalungensis]MBB5156502.1 exopolyphosphatase/guanosine-5'-triphosphate,3'-diphosphate pyrophosphatase [Saccharopolyspora phatthalungensis]
MTVTNDGPLRVAAIDCGTNSIRLLVADLTADRLAPVAQRFEVVRLGQGLDHSGMLTTTARARARRVLSDYATVCTELGAVRRRMCMTWVLRNARNGGDFLAEVADLLGTRPEIIDGAEEARLAFLGAVRDLPPAPHLVADIGGGSTQLALGTTTPQASVSVELGCVRIAERYLHQDPPTADQIATASKAIADLVDDALAALPDTEGASLVGLSEAVTTTAAVALRRAPHRTLVAYRDIARATDWLTHSTAAQRRAHSGIHPRMVDVAAASALAVRAVLERTGKDALLVSDHDILHGIAWSLASGDHHPPLIEG